MADETVDLRLNFDDGDFQQTMDNIIKRLDALESAGKETTTGLNSAFSDASKSTKQYNTELSNTAARTADVASKTQTAATAQQSANKTILDAAKNYRVFGVSVGDITAKLEGQRNALRGLVPAQKGAAGGFKVVGTAMKAIPILALIGAITSLIAFFKRTQRGADLLARGMAGLTAAVDTVIDNFAAAGEILVTWGGIIVNQLLAPMRILIKVMTGDFAGAADVVKKQVADVGNAIDQTSQTLGNLNTQMAENVKRAMELERASQSLRDAQNAFIVTESKLGAELAQNSQLAEDVTQSFDDRIAAAQRASTIENQLLNERLRLAEENFRIIKEQNALSESSADDVKRQNEAEAQLFNLRQTFFERQRRQINVINRINKEREAAEQKAAADAKRAADERAKQLEAERKRIEEIANAYSGLLDTLANAERKARESLLTGAELLKFQLDNQLADIETWADNIRAEFAALGKDLPDNFDETLELMRMSARAKYIKSSDIIDIESLPTSIEQGMNDASNKLDEQMAKVGEQARKSAVAAGESASDGLIDALNFGILEGNAQLQQSVGRLFSNIGLSPQQGAQLINATQQTFGAILDGLSQVYDQQIAETQRVIDELENRVDATEQAIERELELQSEGYAANVEQLQETLAAEQQALDAARQRQLEAEKRANTIRIIQNVAEQISSLTLAAAKIFSTEASKGVVGVVIAIASIAAMFAAFAAARGQAKKASPVPKLKHGGRLDATTGGRLFGRSHLMGGEWLFDDNGHVWNAEAGEHVVNARDSAEHDAFLAALNRGMFRGMDLLSMIRSANAQWGGANGAAVNGTIRVWVAEQRRNTLMLAGVMRQSVRESTERIVGEMRRRPVIYDPTSERTEIVFGENSITRKRVHAS